MKRLVLLRKFQKNFVRLALSLLVAGIFFSAFMLLRSPLQDVLEPDRQEMNFDYEIIQNNAGSVQGVSTKISSLKVETLDSRGWVFDQYLKNNDSPLAGHGEDFVNACDKFNTPHDCTLLIAIAKVETNLCKTGISSKQYNCWGYGGSGENRIIYTSFEQAIDDITGRLMNGYRARFFEDPEAGELFYCGAHCNSWGDKVKDVQNELKAYAKELGYEL
ncbi:hypothetical protein JW978_04115 [Candidatus Dojkabacteria bacterium]|nr:hypothetical protein [Candidatus Dojkabacteria bacterium]